MEKKHRILKNETNIKIKRLISLNNNDTEAISRFSHKTTDLEYNKTQVCKLKDKINQRTMEIEELQNKLYDINSGKLNQEINNTYTDVIEQIKVKTNEKMLNKKMKDDNQKNDKKLYERHRKGEYESNKSYYRQEREMNKTYRYYQNICDSIPDHLLEKLSTQPNNKGFIWRGVYLYGKKDPSGNPNNVSMLERRKGVLFIHEFYPDNYKVWKKDNNNNNNNNNNKNGRNRYKNKHTKELVFTHDRPRKNWGTYNLLDFGNCKL